MAQDRHLQTLIQALLIEAELGAPNGRLYADSLSTALAAHFVNHYSLDRGMNFPDLPVLERQRLGRILDYIEARLSEDIGLTDLALEAGLSKFHFSRWFKQALGFTPHQYVLKRRIERSAQMLKQGHMGIAEVAHAFRFTDQSHFTRVFKQVKGVTPRRFIGQGL